MFMKQRYKCFIFINYGVAAIIFIKAVDRLRNI